MRNLTDQELVSLYLDTNNEWYFGQLYTRYRQLVYQKCLFFTGNSDDSEDYVQDIFVRLTMKLRGFKGDSKFTTWLHTVTANYCIDQLRKKQQHQTLWRSYMREQESLDEQNSTFDESYFHIFERVLNQLPHHQRELLLAKYEDGLQINELASKQDLTSSAVKMRIKRARDRARNLYDRIRLEEEC